MPGAPSSCLFLVVRPGAPSNIETPGCAMYLRSLSAELLPWLARCKKEVANSSQLPNTCGQLSAYFLLVCLLLMLTINFFFLSTVSSARHVQQCLRSIKSRVDHTNQSKPCKTNLQALEVFRLFPPDSFAVAGVGAAAAAFGSFTRRRCRRPRETPEALRH